MKATAITAASTAGGTIRRRGRRRPARVRWTIG